MTALAADILTRVCLGCPEKGPQPWSAFYAARRWPDGTMRTCQPFCKECDKARTRAWRAANPERASQHKRNEWQRQKARRGADPEIAAEARDYGREWMRARRGTPPAHFRFRPGSELVESAPVRGAVELSGLGPSAIALAAGLSDPSSVTRAIGQERMSGSIAARILDAIGVLPAEVGL